MSVISIIESVEIWVSVLLSVVICSLTAYYSFSLSRILFERIYRNRALWTGFVAIGVVVLQIIDVLTSIFTGSLRLGSLPAASRIPQIIVSFVLILIIGAWIDSTIRIAIDQDYFHRNTLRWASFRYLFWASILTLGLLYIFDSHVASDLGAIPLAYAAAALLISGIRSRNRTMRAYLRWFGALILWLSVASSLYYFIPFPNLFPNLFPAVVLAYLIYRTAKSLTPTSSMEFDMPKSSAAT